MSDEAIHPIERKLAAMRRANADPLPGPLLDAFLPAPALTRPVVAGDFIVLKRLNSPLLEQFFKTHELARRVRAGTAAPEEQVSTTLTNDETAELLYLFGNPSGRTRALLAKLSIAEFRTQAVDWVNKSGAAEQLKERLDALQAAFSNIWRTALEYDAEDAAGETTVTFPVAAAGAPDGLGWWLDYLARLCSRFPWTRDFVLDELPMAEGFALLAWSVENNGIEPVRRVGKGYIATEIERLMKDG